MSIFNGKFRRVDKLTGNLTDKKPQLRIKITPLNDVPKVTLSSRGGFSGAWERAGKVFAGATRPLHILYRFLAASVGVLNGRKARAGTAPAQEIEADSATVADVDAPLTPQPAADLDADGRATAQVAAPLTPRLGKRLTAYKKAPFARYAELVAYKRAPLTYIRNIITGRVAGLLAGPGKVAAFLRTTAARLTSKAVAAGSAIMESRFNQSPAGVSVNGATAPAEETAASVAFVAGKVAAPVSAATQDANIQRIVNVSVKAAPYMWFLPEQTDNTLSLFQVFSGVQSGNALEIDMETESVYWANPFVHDGVMELVFAAETAQTDNILEVT